LIKAFAAVALVLALQGRGGQLPPSGRQAAPVDLTGYWVSVIFEDWRFRMVTPPKGDYGAVPLNPEGRRVADTWDAAKDAAAGDSCRVYGAGGIMRVPGRVHITWQDDNTLKLETDAGRQVRTFHFGGAAAPAGEPSLQGYSVANWEMVGGEEGKRWGTLRVVTRGLKPGYLRRNGVPYSENAVITEYYDLLPAVPGREPWFTVTTIVNDPKYLTQEFITSSDFKKERDGSRWNPAPCDAS
jgi:hypothetical protein